MDNRILMSLLLLAATVIGLSSAADPYNAADYDHTGMYTAVSNDCKRLRLFLFIDTLGKKCCDGCFSGLEVITYLSNSIKNKVTLNSHHIFLTGNYDYDYDLFCSC